MSEDGAGKRFADQRRAVGLSQQRLAVASGCTREMVSAAEVGRAKPGRELAVAWERIVGFPVAEWSEGSKAGGL